MIVRGDHELNAVKAQKLPGVASPLRTRGAGSGRRERARDADGRPRPRRRAPAVVETGVYAHLIADGAHVAEHVQAGAEAFHLLLGLALRDDRGGSGGGDHAGDIDAGQPHYTNG